MNRSEYQIVVFPGATSAPRRFRIKRRTVSIVLIASLIAVVLEGTFLVQYVIRSGELWELQSLRSEVADHRGRATAVSAGMEDIRKQLSTMQDINTRLRIMLGLDPPKPGHLPPGLGGKEESDATVTLPGLKDDGSFNETAAQLQKLAWLSGEAGAPGTEHAGTRRHCGHPAGAVGRHAIDLAGPRLGILEVRSTDFPVYR